MAEQENPLLRAVPPESDYLTYLTIIEYNLSYANLSVLHRVLQDENLTTNIGWDLVHLLLPYLPQSAQCLDDIAGLGNPREVILKVTESLRLIDYDTHPGPDAAHVTIGSHLSQRPSEAATAIEGARAEGESHVVGDALPLSPGARQFIALLSMLVTLHARIKTKYPSRFLSTSLQAILASFSNATTDREEMILAVAKFLKAVGGTKRPTLPSRRSGGVASSHGAAKYAPSPANDPEAASDSRSGSGETAIQVKLLQSFLTHIIEEYMLNLALADEDVPGMAWCSRIMENLHPERIIPESTTFASRFAHDELLRRRIDAVGQLVTLAKDLDLTDEELLAAAMTKESIAPDEEGHEDEPPATAEDIPLSRLGSVLLYTARQVSEILYGSYRRPTAHPFAIFAEHKELLQRCMSSPENEIGALGREPESLIDALLALGLVTLERDSIGEPATDEEFTEYLQIAALLSSNCPSGNLRGHAHYLTTTILRSHPNDNVRLAFIRDTLEHCPFENLKVSAVGWIKGETIEANPPSQLFAPETSHQPLVHETSIFATPIALDSLAPFIFPALEADLLKAVVQEAWLTFRTNLPFYLAALNFAYLLLCAKHLHTNLAVQKLWIDNDVAGSFCQPLREASGRFKEAMRDGDELADDQSDEILAELNMLDQCLERVTAAVKFLNE